MICTRIQFVSSLLVIVAMVTVSTGAPRYLLGSDDPNPYRTAVRGPVNMSSLDELNTLFPVTRTLGQYDYLLSGGGARDTFAIVLEPAAACSVYAVQFQWFDGGNMSAFVARYSQAGRDSFPTGRATARRGQTTVSPIGQIIRTFTPNTIGTINPGQWVTANVGLAPNTGFVIGNPATGASDLFVIGFVKGGTSPCPVAENVTGRGFCYTWLGGPINATTPGRWGAYTNVTATTICDVAARCLVSYPWASPIIIQNPKQIPNSFSGTGPWSFTVNLYYNSAIGASDTLRLKWRTLPNGTVNTVPLTALTGVADTYGCTITSTTAVPVGSTIQYWVECTDRNNRRSSSNETPLSFNIIAPTNTNANLLVVTDNLWTTVDGDRFDLYRAAFTTLGLNQTQYEVWDIRTNNGIDRSVTMHGWNNILYIGWGNNGGIPALSYSTANPWVEYVNAGHNLMVADQDYFSGAGIDTAQTFTSGMFAYDKFGVASCRVNPLVLADSVFVGVANDPLTGAFTTAPYATQPQNMFKFTNLYWPNRYTLNDYITVSGGIPIFTGYNDRLVYGCRRVVSNAKLALFPILLEAAALEDTSRDSTGMHYSYRIGTQFPALLGSVLSWFQVMSAPEAVSLNPGDFILESNYPNPFNMTTTFRFSLPKMSKTTLKIYNIAGQEIDNLTDNFLFAGSYRVSWNANNFASGVYFVRLQTEDNIATQKIMLLK